MPNNDEALTELLASLMHWSEENDLDFEGALHLAEYQHMTDVEEELGA